MELKQLALDTEIKAESNGNERTFEAYASVFGNVDNDNDIIVKGAFTETILKRTPKLAYQHDIKKLVGVVKEIKEDETGLLIKGEFLNTPLGDQVYEEVKAGAINQMSVGFRTKDSDFDGKGQRIIKDVDLFEVSFVTFPANESARVTSVKADGCKTVRDFEKILRDVGFSRTKAKSLASHGYKSSDDIERDAALTDLKNSLINLNLNLKIGLKS